MKSYQEKRQEAEHFIKDTIKKHLEVIEDSFENIGLEETFEEYSEKLTNADFSEEQNSVTGDIISAVVDGSVIFSVKLEKNYLDEYSVYENNL